MNLNPKDVSLSSPQKLPQIGPAVAPNLILNGAFANICIFGSLEHASFKQKKFFFKVLMATNRPDTLDPALMRPGRLDRKVEFGLPDLEGRTHIFKIHARAMSVERDIRFELLARLCPNSTGKDSIILLIPYWGVFYFGNSFNYYRTLKFMSKVGFKTDIKKRSKFVHPKNKVPN